MEWSGEIFRWNLDLDVEWCWFLFPDNSQPQQPPLSAGEINWEELAASVGVISKLPPNTSSSSSSQDLAKVTGVVLLLGLGSYLCYRLYKVWLHRHNGEANNWDHSASPPSSYAEGAPAISFHHLSNSPSSINDIVNVQAQYFGPLNINRENDNENQQYQNEVAIEEQQSNVLAPQCSAPSRGWLVNRLKGFAPGPQAQVLNIYGGAKSNRRSPAFSSGTSSTGRQSNQRYSEFSSGTSSTGRQSNQRYSEFSSGTSSTGRQSNQRSPEYRSGTLSTGGQSYQRTPEYRSGTSSTDSSPISLPNQNSLTADLSFDSMGFSGRLHRESSLDSMSSELTFDMPSFADSTTENKTVTRLDKLQEEIDLLKANCLEMDEEIELVKTHRNMPGLSELMEAGENQDDYSVQELLRKQNAKACFKGLYSLTTVNQSLDCSGPGHQQGDDSMSLEWDDDCNVTHNWTLDSFDSTDTTLVPHSPSSPHLSSSMGETSGYESKDMEMDLTCSLSGSQFSGLESPTSPEEPQDSKLEVPRSISCESQEELYSLTDTVSSDLESPLLDNSAFHRQANVGPRLDILTYAQQEWTGNTAKANTILRGYQEVVDGMKYRYLRQIRGDNYCALRSALFQTLAQGLPVPSSSGTMTRLSRVTNIGRTLWCDQWNFNNLPYSGNEVRRGVEICLQSLDNICRMVCSNERTVEEREDTLHNLFNTDLTLDQHVMEALKLHMMAQALDLYYDHRRSKDVPLFSQLMFARDKSETPIDFLNNHLLKVGDVGGLEQVEMCLLGYTLGVTLKVVRLSAHGTEQFVCYYPDDQINNWPQVVLIAEDDRHYNVLCK